MLRIFVTGGTFDKVYNPLSGALELGKTHVHGMLEQGRVGNIAVETLMMKDSLDMTTEDRQLILEKCMSSPEERIVVTHGTDTMVDTARVLASGVKEKTVVLTGAMVPHRFTGSDALFNLGFAIGSARRLPAGVYVAINGLVFRWDKVRKNRDRGEFEEF